MLDTLTFITGNKAKAAQVSRHFTFPLTHKKLDLPEIQSLELSEIVKYKAQEAYRQLKSPILVEDTSLTFQAMGKLPGTLIKWFLQELGNEGLCRELDRFEDRSAIAEVTFGLHDGQNVILFNSQIHGSIASEPRGPHIFGWDPIFIPIGQQKTWAEMSMEEQDRTSMRKVALLKLEEYLQL